MADKAVLAINEAKKKLGLTGPGLNPTADTADEEKPARDYSWIMPAGATQMAAAETPNAYKKNEPPKTPTTKVVVELKLELGEGNEDAIYIASHKAIAEKLRNATAVQRTSRLRGL